VRQYLDTPSFWLLAVAWFAVLLTMGCADRPDDPPRLFQQLSGPTSMSGSAIKDETERLRIALSRAIPSSAARVTRDDHAWIVRTMAALASARIGIGRPQTIVVVDRAPLVQEMVVIVSRSDGPWEVLGGSRISTGQTGRRGYFITPSGVFIHDSAIVDYRAKGSFNQNHIRGLGIKGMRVWDFGWRTALKGWTRNGSAVPIRFLMHATDPDVLEPRLGRQASMGCIRIPAAMNRFLDLNGILDVDLERAAKTDARFHAVLDPWRHPTPLAGDKLVVVDSSEPDPPS